MEPLFLTLDEVLSLHASRSASSADRRVSATLDCCSPRLGASKQPSMVDADEDAFYDLVIGVAEGHVSKASVTVFLEEHAA